MDLRAYLIEAGVPEGEVDAAAADGSESLRILAFERLLLPSERRLTPPEVWAAVGDDDEFGRVLWRAMGFADVPDDVAALTEHDVDALRSVQEMLAADVADRDTVLRMARLMGQAMSRVADALVAQFRAGLAQRAAEGDDLVDDLLPLGNLVLEPLLERQLVYLLRRHLIDAGRRQLSSGTEGGATRLVTVGFADLVRFTEVSQRLDEVEISRLVERFESTAAQVVTGVGGQVVKLIGDEVMFTTDEPAEGVRAALELSEAFEGDDVPAVRVGLACGTVVVHQGDLFGPIVNLASRAVGVANPGAVIVSAELAEHIADEPDLRTKPIRTRNLKGIGRTHLHVVRRAAL